MTTEQEDGDDFQQELKAQANELVQMLEKGEFSESGKIIQQLSETRDKSLYKEVGKLTRALHDAIVNFHIDAGISEQVSQEMSEMGSASDRLNFVIEKTNAAANKTMDKVEESVPVAEQLGNEAGLLKNEWARFMKKELSPQEFSALAKRVGVFLGHIETNANTLQGNFSEILLAQDFQDLTGQVIKKVITLVSEVESNLVNMVRMAGQVEELTGIQTDLSEVTLSDAGEAQGPQMNAEKRDDVVSNQDEVDDLLSSLGF